MGLNERNIQMPFFEKKMDCRSERMGTSCIPSEEGRSNEVPQIVLCYNGKSIKIHEDLVVNGLSAISIKHHKGNCNDERRTSEDSTASRIKEAKNLDNTENETNAKKIGGMHYREFSKTTTDVPECLKDKMKRRNSFWNVHRPELSKLTWPENFVSSAVLQDFFHNHLRIHGTFCEPLHEFSNRSSQMDEEFQNYSKLREIVPPRVLPPDEKVINIMEKSRSVQLNDEDLDPETMVHKSRAEFCVTIGEYIRRPALKRTTSQQMPKCYVQPASRYESLPVQHESLLSKDAMTSEEKVFTVIGSTDFFLNATAKKSSKKLNVGNISGILLRSASVTDSQRLVVTSPPSLNAFGQQLEGAEESGDPARAAPNCSRINSGLCDESQSSRSGGKSRKGPTRSNGRSRERSGDVGETQRRQKQKTRHRLTKFSSASNVLSPTVKSFRTD